MNLNWIMSGSIWKRVEEEKGKFDFVISRAVMEFTGFVGLTVKNLEIRQ